jgi:ribosome maturation factor RimP
LYLGTFSRPAGVPNSTRDSVSEALRAAVARIARSHGLDLFDVQFRRESIGWVLRVTLDREAPSGEAAGATAEDPVGIDDCKRVSEDLSAALDVEPDLLGDVGRGYTLEVSSPGLDRPLRGEADYRRFTGRLAKIVTREPVDGQSHFEGRLAGVEGADVLVAQGKRVHRVPVNLISRARLEVEF